MNPADITIDNLPNPQEMLRRAIKILGTGNDKERNNVLNMFDGITVAEFTNGKPLSLVLQ